MMKKLSTLLLCLLAGLYTYAQQSAAEIYHEIQKLSPQPKVLYLAAHPDDENTRLISWLVNERKAEVAYLSLTRGSGGQNLIGEQLSEGLGIIRSEELQAARRTDGGIQYFSRALDFGYSKNPEETLEKWDEEKVLEDMVWVIRHFQPDIIITRFSHEKRVGRATHGHHTASAILGQKAMDAAADKSQYPHQLKTLRPWQVTRLMWNTSWWFFGSKEVLDSVINHHPNQYLKYDVNAYLPNVGLHCGEIAALSRSQHKSQGFGSAPSYGPEWEYLKFIKGTQPENDLFDGINNQIEIQVNPVIYKEYKAHLDELIKNFDFNHPEKSIDKLAKMAALVNTAQLFPRKDEFRIQLSKIALACAGVDFRFTAPENVYAQQEDLEATIYPIVKNTDGIIELIEAAGNRWKITAGSQELTIDMAATKPDEKFKLNYSYQGNASNCLIPEGSIHTAMHYPHILPVPYTEMQGAKVETGPFKWFVPLQKTYTDRVKGEVFEQVRFIPPVNLQFENDVLIPNSEKIVASSIQISALSDISKGKLVLSLPNSIQLVESSWPEFLSLKKGEVKTFAFKVKVSNSKVSENIGLSMLIGGKVYNTRSQALTFDHIPTRYWLREAKATVLPQPISLNIKKVGYLMGAGDEVPAAIEKMGAQVTILTLSDLTTDNLSQFDALVFGIRVYNTLPDLCQYHETLKNYVENGGTWIVQYNTTRGLYCDDLQGLLPLKLSRDRVTVEESPVKILEKNHPAITGPNPITEADFENWNQERGLYFPNSWDQQYVAILETNEPHESATQGSLLVAKLGEGHFVYTGLSLFRHLPVGINGSYKILANLLSLSSK